MSVQDYSWRSTKKLYVGCSGSGKTTLFFQHASREKARVKFWYDHKAMEFSQRFGLKPLFEADELMEQTIKGGNVCFVPSRMFPGKPDEGFAFFCDFVFSVSEQFKGRKLLCADELQRLVGTNSKPDTLLTLCDVGRTYQIDCFFIASSANTIHNLVRHQITEVFAFRQGTKNAVEWLEEKGFDPEKLQTLKNGEWLQRNLDTGEAGSGGKAF